MPLTITSNGTSVRIHPYVYRKDSFSSTPVEKKHSRRARSKGTETRDASELQELLGCEKNERSDVGGWCLFYIQYGCFQKLEVPKNGWFIMGNLIKMGCSLWFKGSIISRWWQLTYFLCSPRKFGEDEPILTIKGVGSTTN